MPAAGTGDGRVLIEKFESINSLIQNAKEVLNTRDVTDIERQQVQDELYHLKVQQTQTAAALEALLRGAHYQTPDGAMDLYRSHMPPRKAAEPEDEAVDHEA